MYELTINCVDFLGVHIKVGVGGLHPCIKLVRVILQTSDLAHKYTHICSFNKHTFQYQSPLKFADVSIFFEKSAFFGKIVPLLKSIV